MRLSDNEYKVKEQKIREYVKDSYFSPKQQDAISKAGHNILVSAGAGSGKTAVLSERVLRKVLTGTHIDNILVLTFTELAAAEMKERIRKKLKKEETLKEELEKLDLSYITTFDSFSLSIVKKYHNLLGVSKNISIIDKIILDNKIEEILENIFEDLYKENNNEFLHLINDFCIKDDKNIKKAIINLNSKLDLLINKEEYLNNYINSIYNDNYFNTLLDKYLDKINKIVDETIDCLETLDSICNNENFFNSLYCVLQFLYDYKRINRDEIFRVKEIDYPRAPSGKNCLDPECKVLNSKIKDNIVKLKNLLQYESFDEIKTIFYSTKDYSIAIIDIVKKLDIELNNYKYNEDLYDFSDIAKLAIKVVKENPEVRLELKNQFEEILLDEYQDTSDVQEELMNLISDNNLFMVGDIKQSIYRFRNAEPSIFRDKFENYKKENSLGNFEDGELIELSQNFRSREEVLDDINFMFDFMLDLEVGDVDYRKSHHMNFGQKSYNELGKKYNSDYYSRFIEYPYDKEKGFNKQEIEAFIIARDIKDKVINKFNLFDKENKTYHEATYSDFCILMDRGSSFNTYKKIFNYLNIPINVYSGETLSESDDLLVLQNIFKMLVCIKDSYKKIEDRETSDIDLKYSFMSIARSFLYSMDDGLIFKIINDNKIEETDIYKKLLEISNNIDNIPLTKIIDKIVDSFNYYECLLKKDNIDSLIAHLDKIYDLANNLSNSGYTYIMFSEYLESVYKNKQDISFKLNKEDSNAVKVMTIHASKGLEFPICYFPGLYPKFNNSDVKERFIFDKNIGIISPYFMVDKGIGDMFTKSIFSDNYKQAEISEKIRLFYVSTTRAMEQMIFVYPKLDEDKEDSFSNLIENGIINTDTRLSYQNYVNFIYSIKDELIKNNKVHFEDSDLDSINLTKDYIINIDKNKYESNNKEIIELKSIPKQNPIIKEQKSFSHKVNIINKEIKNNLEFGTYIHYLLEITDFKNPDYSNIDSKYKMYIERFLNNDLLKDIKEAKILKEYEFIDESDNTLNNGIIDLLLEYNDHIDIIDYKTKDISNDAYITQLNGYKDYISKLSNKDINIYLYSILENEFKKL